MKLKFLLSISPIFAINCNKETSDSGTTTISCDDLDQNLSGIEYFNFKQFKEDIHSLKLKLNGDVQNINVGYKNLLKTALDPMREIWQSWVWFILIMTLDRIFVVKMIVFG